MCSEAELDGHQAAVKGSFPAKKTNAAFAFNSGCSDLRAWLAIAVPLRQFDPLYGGMVMAPRQLCHATATRSDKPSLHCVLTSPMADKRKRHTWPDLSLHLAT